MFTYCSDRDSGMTSSEDPGIIQVGSAPPNFRERLTKGDAVTGLPTLLRHIIMVKDMEGW